MVFEIQGGIEPRCAAILHRVATAVATVEGADFVVTKAALLQRIAVVIARGTADAIRRRDAQCSGSSKVVCSAAAQILSEATDDEEVIG